MLRLGTACVVVALGFMAGGCTSQSVEQHTTRASFIKAADARCTSETDAGVSIDGTNLPRTAAMLEPTIAARTRMEKDLKSLGVPPGDGAALAAFFKAYDRHQAALKDLQAAAAHGNVELFTQANRAESDRMNDMMNQATAYGFQFCGRY